MPVAVITGGSRGIGRATVELLASHGWRTAFCYHSSDAAADEVAKKTGAFAFRADVADAEAVDRFIDAVIRREGKIDLLVNNAGVSVSGLFTDITAEQWRRMSDVNIGGTLNCTRSVLPHMIRRKSGRIVNISSVWGVTGGSCEVHYSATKAAIIGFTRALAKEVGPSGITVNCIAPGVIDTDMNARLSQEDTAELIGETPLGRIGAPIDVARTVEFLAGDGGSFVTGQVISVDGGWCV